MKYVLRNAKRLPPEHDHSILWAYERHLPDYDPSEYAAASSAVKNQSIRLRTRKGARSADQSDSDEHLTPAQRVDARLRAADNHHARSLNASPLAIANVPIWSGHAQESVKDGDSPTQARRKLDEQDDAKVVSRANAQWAKFRKQQVPLRNLQHELDAVKAEATRLEQEHEQARHRGDTREQRKLEAELHPLHEREVELQRQLDESPYRPPTLDPRAPPRENPDDGLDAAARHRLEREHATYSEYARDRDAKLERLRYGRRRHEVLNAHRSSSDEGDERARRTSEEESSAAEQEQGLLPSSEEAHSGADEQSSAEAEPKRSRWRRRVTGHSTRNSRK